MKSINEMMRYNASVSPEQARHILERAVYAARQKMIARKLLGPDIVTYNDEGVQSIGVDTMTEIADAVMGMDLPTDADIIDQTRAYTAIPYTARPFLIRRSDLAASKRTGQPLDLTNVDSATYKVSKLENAYLLNGHSLDGTNYDYNGMYQGAGNTYSTSKDFGTAGNASDAISGAIALLEADGFEPPYNLVLNSTQKNELAISEMTGGTMEVAMIRNLLSSGFSDKLIPSQYGGMILTSPAMVAGTGLVMAAPGTGAYKYHLAKDLTVETTILEKTKDLFGIVWLKGRFIYYDANAGAQMSAI